MHEEDRPMNASSPPDRNPQSPPPDPGDDPVAYMLAVMADDAADPGRRDGMAKAVAPYLRPKARAGGADGRELLDQAVAGAKQSLARKLDRLSEAMAQRAKMKPK
jgi:hypothetical protein